MKEAIMSSNTIKGFFIAVLAVVSNAHAEPAPLPTEKMWEYSDAIVVVDVLSVTHTGEKGLQDEPVYLVKMRVREVRKGNVRVGHIMSWQMSNYQPPAGGYGGGVAYPGERLLYYLKSYPNGTYNTWGHNCCETIRQAPPAQRRLPKHRGETIYAAGGEAGKDSNIHRRCRPVLPSSSETRLPNWSGSR